MATWDLQGMKHHLLICNGGSCMLKDGEEVTQAIRDEIARHHADALIHTTRTRCNGRCEDACIVIHYPEGKWYKEVTPDIGRQLVNDLISSTQTLPQQIIYKYEQGFVATGHASLGVTKEQAVKTRNS
jgi:(2Fe-2S) ferredoxin